MKKRVYLHYGIIFFVLVLACQLFLTLFLFGYAEKQNLRRRLEKLEDAAQNVKMTVTALVEASDWDFEYLLHYETELLRSLAENGIPEGVDLLIVGLGGEKLVFSDLASGATPGGQLLDLAAEKAASGEVFRSRLEGIFSEERLCRAMLMEKEHGNAYLQRVGAVFVSVSAKTENSLLSRDFLPGYLFFAGLNLLVILLFGYLIFVEMIRPLQGLDRMARAFSKNDFSFRLEEKDGGELLPLFRTFNETAGRVEKNELARQSFVSNVSHDLRTPLTTIGGFIQNMQEGIIPPEKQGYYFGIILDEVNRLARLVQTLLETSRMTSGQRKYRFEPMDLCELGRITLLSFEKRIEEKKLEVSFEADEDSLFVLADRDAIQQVINNLLDNAVKFSPEGGSLSLRVERKEKKAFFAVKNSGEGIPEEELSHLFDRFYKSDRSRGLDKQGMGLGLFIVKSVISAHSEEIWVESRRGSYTRFVFSLPITQGKAKRSS